MTVNRVQVELAAVPPFIGIATIAFWATTPDSGLTDICGLIGATPASVSYAQAVRPPAPGSAAAIALTIGTEMVFIDSEGKHKTRLYVPCPLSWFDVDEETLNLSNADVVALISAFTAAGLCASDGTLLTQCVSGQRTALSLAPWPIP